MIVGEGLARVIEKFFADLLDGLTAMPLVEIALSMQHIIRQAVEERCLTRANVTDNADELALFDLQ